MPSAKQTNIAALRRHIERLERRVRRLDRLSRRYAWTRLGLVITGSVAAFLMFQTVGTGAGWSVITGFATAFIITARSHRRVDESMQRHQIWRRIKAMHVARMTLDWEAIPRPSSFPPDPDHPFEIDLNLTGLRSMHHLLDTATSRGGSKRLWTWLREPLLDLDRLRRRQALVREVASLPVFRDRLILHGTLIATDPDTPWDGEGLQRWLEQHARAGSLKPLLLLLSALAAANMVLFVLYWLTPMPAFWAVSFVIYAGIYLFNYRRLGSLFNEAYHLEKALRGFRHVAAYLESYRYGVHHALAKLCAPFLDPGHRPSAYLKRVARVAAAASSQKSEVLILVLNALVPWDLFFSYRLDRHKEALCARLPAWLEAWYEVEAVSALATFADLNPEYTFPALLPSSASDEEPIFSAMQLGHPLIPDGQKVCNDVAVHRPGAIHIITGSNMSGKSTFLRTVGVNLCLAYAGGPVNAAQCRTRLFRLFTCINVSDSVHDGISYFYAEVRRLKHLLMTLADDHPAPVFFLIDEIFRGTNNRERLLGGRAYVRALAGHRATGLISTHDLELVTLADDVARVYNAHFREEVVDGRMVFDYRLRPGPCPTTNALKIMRMEGLPVEPTSLPTVD
ncbi:MAG: MutS family DNA mismatch repair protein [Rhodothermales bacterium]